MARLDVGLGVWLGSVWFGLGREAVIKCNAMRCERGKRCGWGFDLVVIVLYYLSYVGVETFFPTCPSFHFLLRPQLRLTLVPLLGTFTLTSICGLTLLSVPG